ncbi:MAG TPA: hypothetical protein PL190_02940 [Caldisericia bacterium]|nr:MAG: hypothetical protein BWX90_01306 [bacterium ADurb.Bin132]HNY61108.1 hypothetical protein [Caldisericia bacterium]HOC79080.1 hypothetical protein [Caldisericia bacterium]HOG70118.1 hypothetical protein [Caldisericia bacterium]HPA65474.1 hypothetical protein [Caldisericia bacterium]
MQKKLVVLGVVTLVAILCASCGSGWINNGTYLEKSTEELQPAKTGWIATPKEDLNNKLEKGQPMDKDFVPWEAEEFDGSGQLGKKWNIKLKDKTIPSFFLDLKALKQGWMVSTPIDAFDGYKPFLGMIDPETGKIKKIKDKYYKMGPTNGEYVIVNGPLGSLSADSCWKIYGSKVLWSSSSTSIIPEYYFVSGKLIKTGILAESINKENDIRSINSIDPWTGEVLWEIINPLYDLHYAKTSDKYAFTKLNDSKNKMSYLVRIDPETGKVDEVKLPYYQIHGIEPIGKNIWISSSEGHLAMIDEESMKTATSVKIGMSGTLYSIGGYILVSSNITKESVLYDPESGKSMTINAQSANVINGTLVLEEKDKIRGADPKTLATTWWIDKKDLGTETSVVWLDWRGVVVQSKGSMACFTMPGK